MARSAALRAQQTIATNKTLDLCGRRYGYRKSLNHLKHDKNQNGWSCVLWSSSWINLTYLDVALSLAIRFFGCFRKPSDFRKRRSDYRERLNPDVVDGFRSQGYRLKVQGDCAGNRWTRHTKEPKSLLQNVGPSGTVLLFRTGRSSKVL